MPRTPRLLPLVAAALLLPAATASAASFSGTTSEGSPITFDATGDQISNVVSALPMVCTGRAGIEPFQPSGTFTADGTESKLTELRPSAVLGRDATQNLALTATIDGTQASGKIALNYATTDFDVFTMTTTITVCAGSADFTASAPPPPVVGGGDQQADQPAKQPAKKKKKKKKGGARKGHGKHV